MHIKMLKIESVVVMNGFQNNIYIRQGIAKIWNYVRKGLELIFTILIDMITAEMTVYLKIDIHSECLAMP